MGLRHGHFFIFQSYSFIGYSCRLCAVHVYDTTVVVAPDESIRFVTSQIQRGTLNMEQGPKYGT